MKKHLLHLFTTLAFIAGMFVQTANADIGVVVTNPANTTPNLASGYTSLALALADLNAVTAMSGPVTLKLEFDASETVPPTGLTIGSTSLNAVLSSVNTVTIMTAGGTVTLNAGIGTATPASAVPDGMLKIVGADYITIDGLTFTDGNAANQATMEFGLGLFKASLSDGAQNNTIINCAFNMQRINNTSGTAPMVDGSVGILVINATPSAATTALVPTAAAGTNSYNKFYSNTFNGGNYGIALSGYSASTPFTTGDTGNDIGGASSGTGNNILNFGGAAAAANPAAGIRANNQWGINISYNIVNNNNGSGVNHPLTLRGIYAQAGTSANATINNNNVTIKGGALTNSIYGIDNGIGSTAASNTVDIKYNTVTGTYSTATTGAFYGIQNTGSAATVNVAYNLVSGISTPGTGAIYGMTLGSPAALNVNNNNVTTLTKTGIGTIYGIQMSTATITCQINTVDGLSCTAASSTASIYGIYDGASAVVENYSNNIVKNLSSTGTATIYGLYINTATGNKTVQNNQLFNFTMAGSGTIYGFSLSYGSTDIISENQIHDLNITGSTSGTIYGLRIAAGATNNVYLNNIYSLTCAGGTGGAIYGLYIATGTTNNVYRNKVCNLSSGSSNPGVYGAYLASGTTNNLHNNLIGNLTTPAANAAIPLAGIYVAGGSNANVFYNTVYLNATSTGAIFGSAAVYASTTPTVDLRNNILVNTSTPNGATGFTAAYRRSGTALGTYKSTSNNNYYYAGSPSSTMLIFYDGTNSDPTLAAFQTRVAPRDAFSLTSVGGPSFLSTTCSEANFLHINPAVSSVIESGGTAISTFDNDFDGNIRQGSAGYPAQVNGGGSAPDIGGDEYDGIPNYTCTAPSPGNTLTSANSLCLGQTITLSLQNTSVGTGNSYQWQSSANGTSYSNILSSNTATYTVTPDASLYYQCIVTCQNGPVSATSNPILITFANSILTTTPGSHCGPGTVNLAATGSGGTLNWYAAATGGAPLGSGSAFTTPSISTTTSFYVAAENISSANATVGAGASTSTGSESPFYYLWGGHKSQFLVKASELIAAGLSAGNITACSFEVAASTGMTFQGFNLSIGTTASSALTTTFETGLSNVYSTTAPAGITPTNGIFTISFSSAPFYWNGSSNIVVETCWSNNNSGSSANSATVKYDATSFVSNAYRRTDNVTPAVICANTTASGTMSSRPKMIFAGQGSCSSPRSAVIATIDTPPALTISGNQTVCNNNPAMITVTSYLPDFDTYVWTPATNLFTNEACTDDYISGASAQTVYVKSTTAGTPTYTCTGTKISTSCVNVAQSVVTTLPASPVIVPTPSNLCISGSSVITTVPSTGYGTATFQWQVSSNGIDFSDITDANAISYTTPTLTSTRYYKLLVKLGGYTCTESIMDTVFVNNPQLSGTTPGSRCGTGTVELGATGSGGMLNWYSSALGGTLLGTGPAFITPIINTTTSYYVAAVSSGSNTYSVGKPTTNGADGTNTTGGLVFDAYAPFTLNYVYIYPIGTGSGTITIQLQNASSAVLQTATVTVTGTAAPGIRTLIPLNFDVAVGTGLKLVATAYTGLVTSMIRDYTTALPATAFPYTVPGVLSITGATLSPYYYYFYDWTVSVGCSTARTEVVATVTSPPAITPTALPLTICEGDNSNLNVTSPNDPNFNYVWTPGALAGAAQVVSTVITTQYTVTATDPSTGCVTTGNVTVTVNPAPTVITITPSAPVIDPGAIQILSASGGIIPDVALLSENFNDVTNSWTTANTSTLGTPANAAWTLRADGYIYGSTPVTFHSNDNSQFYISNSDAQGSGGITNTELISPVLNTTGFTSLALKFWHYFRYTDSESQAKVEVSLDGGTNWEATPLASYTSTQGAAAGFVQVTLDLSAYVNQPDLKIRFRYHDTYGWYWCIDNVSVIGSAQAALTWGPLTGLYTDPEANYAYSGTNTDTVYAKPAVTTTYTATSLSLLGCPRTANVTVSVGSDKLLNLKVYLEGPYDAGSNTMLTQLNDNALIPLGQPFSGEPWNYGGLENVTAIPAGVVDWVLVDLRDAPTPEEAVPGTEVDGWPKAYFLLADGSIVDLEGTSQPSMGNPTIVNNLYAIVRHRNHIAIMSADAVILNEGTYAYDFSIALSRAYGGGAGYKELGTGSGVFGMVSGDADADGEISVIDFDRWATDFGQTYVYMQTDLDMDTEISVIDFDKWATNFGVNNPILGVMKHLKYKTQVPGNKTN